VPAVCSLTVKGSVFEIDIDLPGSVCVTSALLCLRLIVSALMFRCLVVR